MVEHHHRGEDRGAFPMLAKIDPEFASRVPVLTFYHHEIDRIVEEIQAGFVQVGINQPVQALAESYRQLVGLIKLPQKLSDHLEREEAVISRRWPAISACNSNARLRKVFISECPTITWP